MHLSVRQLPNQPCFNRTEKQFSRFRFFSCARHIVKNPLELRTAEISVNQKPCLFADFLAETLLFQAVAVLRGSAALPHNCIVNRHSGFLIPDHRCLSLIRNADGLDILISSVNFQKRLLRHAHLRRPDFHRVVLNPARLWVNLRELFLGGAYDSALFIVKNTARACRALIQRHYVFSHAASFSFFSKP